MDFGQSLKSIPMLSVPGAFLVIFLAHQPWGPPLVHKQRYGHVTTAHLPAGGRHPGEVLPAAAGDMAGACAAVRGALWGETGAALVMGWRHAVAVASIHAAGTFMLLFVHTDALQ